MAKASGAKTYLTGLPCHRGHVTNRYTISGGCIECTYLNAQSPERKAHKSLYGKVYVQSHRAILTQKDQVYRQRNPEKIKAKEHRYYARNRDLILARRRTPESRDERYFQGLKSRFGIDQAAYQAIVEKQKGCCAICLEPPVDDKKGRGFHADHDHVTGAFRGLVCRRCNVLLGFMHTHFILVGPALRYLAAAGSLGLSDSD